MDVRVLDMNLAAIALIDQYESFIWTDRYYAYGDFELYIPASTELFAYIKQNYYLQIEDSDHLMIIEKIQIQSDVEDGDKVIVSGRSLESILDRRIVWGQRTLDGNFQNGIKTLLNEAIISPSDSNRKISNFIFEASTDTAITKLTLKAQYTGDNLYDIIKALCESTGVGFKITLNSSNQFVFKLYNGSDRSYSQTTNPYVKFSSHFENIINSNYMETNSELKTITLIGGEGEGSERRYTSYTVQNATGLNRRELFTDARDISSKVDGETLSDAEYIKQLQERGKEDLTDYTASTSFEGETETTIMFKYNEDFYDGDIVQISDDYGHDQAVRIIEIVHSIESSGSSVYPTFTTDYNVPTSSSGSSSSSGTTTTTPTKKTYSVLGDSYSAFNGDFTPTTNAKYYPHADVQDVGQMWYRLVASAKGWITAPNQNNAYGGSRVNNSTPYTTQKYPSFLDRVTNLKDADYLLIEGGINDSNGSNDPGSPVYSNWTSAQLNYYLPALCYLFAYIQGHFKAKPVFVIMKDHMKSNFVSGAETVCKHYGITYVVCTGYAVQDGHPTKAGMQTIANSITNVI